VCSVTRHGQAGPCNTLESCGFGRRQVSTVYELDCRDTPKLTAAELQEYLRAIPAWTVNADQSELHREFIAKNFVAAIDFFTKVKDIAEAEGHHPDLHLTNYRSVRIVVSTHEVGGLTMLDLILAAKLDEIECSYSPKWLRQQEEKYAGDQEEAKS
jgi:4a-hydroxytetrahydrobiopterin dehydratase